MLYLFLMFKFLTNVFRYKIYIYTSNIINIDGGMS